MFHLMFHLVFHYCVVVGLDLTVLVRFLMICFGLKWE